MAWFWALSERVLEGIRPQALPASSGWSSNPHWHSGSAGTAGKGRGCCFGSQSHTDSSQMTVQTRSSPVWLWRQPWEPQKRGKDPSTSSSTSTHVHAPSMRNDHCGMRIRTQGGSEGSSGTPNRLSFVSRQDPHHSIPVDAPHPAVPAGMELSVVGAPAGGGRRRGPSSAGSGAAV